MGQPLLLEYYEEIPQRQPNEPTALWTPRFRQALKRFQQNVERRYSEPTLERLLWTSSAPVRQAAIVALGLVGTMKCSESVASMLHDEDHAVRMLATDALWSIWFRADSPQNNQELQRLMRLSVESTATDEVLAGFEALIKKAPHFAEAYNQRAIVWFRAGEHARSVADCEKVLKLNPQHFGAASGMAQCFMKLKKFRAALRTFRRAYRLNPNLEGIHDAIQSLEKMLGEGRNKG